ncbi:MAG: T9SS type A sorting domain-containing protein [Bacteroidia bacterium]|nr:T9SS type A sorting domain-containing protein [Bacteroidia bacterium]
MLSVLFSQAQTFPYLNASTGNEGEFPVDKDTNIYMFHGNRLVKTDKNFNVIWANTYTGLNFKSLLLSKTGSIFFMGDVTGAGSSFGKLNPNGNVVWITNAIITMGANTNTLTCERIFLDRNNHLVITGSETLIKCDTLGNPIKLKKFSGTCFGALKILTDSSGVYKLVGGGMIAISAFGEAIHSYNDNMDVFTGIQLFGAGYPPFTGYKMKLIKSKFNDNFYMQVELMQTTFNVNSVQKFSTHGALKWTYSNSIYNASKYQIGEHLEESDSGDLLVTFTSGGSNTNFNSSVLRLDSMGNTLGNGMSMFSNYNLGFSVWNRPLHFARSFYSNNYYFDVSGQSFPVNPLTIQKFNSAMTHSCSIPVTYTYALGGIGQVPSMPVATPTIQTIINYSLNSLLINVTPVTFSVNTNFCTVLNIENHELNGKLNLSPNPAHSKIVINASDKIESVEVYDISGKLISTHSNTNEIDVSELTQGMYFLRMNFGNEIVTKKFIKE